MDIVWKLTLIIFLVKMNPLVWIILEPRTTLNELQNAFKELFHDYLKPYKKNILLQNKFIIF
jgi:hypothetical protein